MIKLAILVVALWHPSHHDVASYSSDRIKDGLLSTKKWHAPKKVGPLSGSLHPYYVKNILEHNCYDGEYSNFKFIRLDKIKVTHIRSNGSCLGVCFSGSQIRKRISAALRVFDCDYRLKASCWRLPAISNNELHFPLNIFISDLGRNSAPVDGQVRPNLRLTDPPGVIHHVMGSSESGSNEVVPLRWTVWQRS